MASLDDVVTVQKNGVVAINALTAALETFRKIYQSYVGDKTFLGATDPSLLISGAGRIVNFTVGDGGSAVGYLHDADSVDGATTANIIAVIGTTEGTFQVNMPFTKGLVVKPGTGQNVSICYS